nr:hypothetical protein [Peribacillus simplex]
MLLKFAIQDFLDDREFRNLSPATVFKIKQVKEEIKIEVFSDYHIKQMLNYYLKGLLHRLDDIHNDDAKTTKVAFEIPGLDLTIPKL